LASARSVSLRLIKAADRVIAPRVFVSSPSIQPCVQCIHAFADSRADTRLTVTSPGNVGSYHFPDGPGTMAAASSSVDATQERGSPWNRWRCTPQNRTRVDTSKPATTRVAAETGCRSTSRPSSTRKSVEYRVAQALRSANQVRCNPSLSGTPLFGGVDQSRDDVSRDALLGAACPEHASTSSADQPAQQGGTRRP
jgi:hypothetical protein